MNKDSAIIVISPSIGIISKLNSQSAAVTKGKLPLEIIVIGSTENVRLHPDIIQIPFKQSRWKIINHIKRMFVFYKACKKYSTVFTRELRKTPVSLGVIFFLRKKLIFEIHSKYFLELKLRGLRMRSFLENSISSFNYNFCRGIITITNELKDFISAKYSTRPILTVPPGMPNTGIAGLKIIDPQQSTFRFVLAARSIRDCYGLDYLINGIKRYNGKSKVILSLIISEKVPEINLNEEFIETKYDLSEAEIHKEIETCDLGIGVLAGQRIGLKELAPIKERLYFAEGLPYVCSHADPGFPVGSPLIYNYSSIDEGNIINDVLQFLEGLRKSDIAKLTDQWKKDLHRLSWENVLNQYLGFGNRNF